MHETPQLSVVLASHNRRAVLLRTLDRLADCGLSPHEMEVIVVDNASEDGTPEALRRRGDVRLVALDRNLGACAKALGVDEARAPVVLFLDDDSWPRPGCLERMLRRFEIDDTLGAAGFTVHLLDGSGECSALPHVFVGCGVGLRRSALREIGGLDRSFFMQAEEYDVALRLLRAGWRSEIFADLQVEHAKTPVARRSERTLLYDVRNNLRIIARYLPDDHATICREDWVQRYRWMAERDGRLGAFERGRAEGERLAAEERVPYARWRLRPPELEQVFCWSAIQRRMQRLAAAGTKRIVLADLSKNLFAFLRGAQAAGLAVLAVADDNLAAPGRAYRGVPVTPVAAALALGPDAVVVSNTSYIHAQRRCEQLRELTSLPVHHWFGPPTQTALPVTGAARREPSATARL